MAEGESGCKGAKDHEHEGHAVDVLAVHLITELTKEELAREGATEGNAIDSRGDIGGWGFEGLRVISVVVDATKELGDEGDAKEVVGVGEEAHANDHDGHEVVPLHLCHVQSIQHLELLLCLDGRLPFFLPPLLYLCLQRRRALLSTKRMRAWWP